MNISIRLVTGLLLIVLGYVLRILTLDNEPCEITAKGMISFGWLFILAWIVFAVVPKI